MVGPNVQDPFEITYTVTYGSEKCKTPILNYEGSKEMSAEL
jgi:hypothetical protein